MTEQDSTQPQPPARDPDDVALAALLHPWVGLHHMGGNAKIAKAAQAWLAAKGL